ncbi:hypothetical protein OIE71_04510 [Streptomyces sp. NBC_01725]|uniref:hypothetical protein n=1 Tax=Streptomyces sp. NBC_01725 TaxID=2975923 RepID=UPI002E2E5795|nr:hypothetical protein [Streptomyces sp. NBC_01725]
MRRELLCVHGYLLAQDQCHHCETAAKKPHTSDPVIVDAGATSQMLCGECGTRPGDAVHWTAEGTPVVGPPTVSVEQTDDGAALDVTDFVTGLVLSLAQGQFEDLAAIAELYETAAPHDGHAREQLLVEELVEQLGTRISVSGVRAAEMSTELRRAADAALVEQRRGAA